MLNVSDSASGEPRVCALCHAPLVTIVQQATRRAAEDQSYEQSERHICSDPQCQTHRRNVDPNA